LIHSQSSWVTKLTSEFLEASESTVATDATEATSASENSETTEASTAAPESTQAPKVTTAEAPSTTEAPEVPEFTTRPTTKAPVTSFGCSNANGMSDTIRRTFLKMHNRFRSSLARGLEHDKLIGGNAAKAAKMLKMVGEFTISQLINTYTR
ncbi:hypothetical protein OESDEN_24220, partial [Oesophagostomum dentatum]